jgi:hypothetical protein
MKLHCVEAGSTGCSLPMGSSNVGCVLLKKDQSKAAMDGPR